MDPITVVLTAVNLVMLGVGIGKASEQKEEKEEKPEDTDDGGGTWCAS